MAEYHDEDEGGKKRRKKQSEILEKGEGLEALLGSVSTYAHNTQSMFIVPFIIFYIILFPNETMIPQGYMIAQRELPYYLSFAFIIILPQMVIDVFLLHLLEVIWGFKVYDYFTYSEYKFRTREQNWINQEKYARSIIHSWRSLDNFSFSQQYYYTSALMSWGFIFQCMGMTIFLRQGYNPFADPMIFAFVPLVAIVVWIVKSSMDAVQQYFKIWQVEHNPISTVDVSQINKLDNESNLRQ